MSLIIKGYPESVQTSKIGPELLFLAHAEVLSDLDKFDPQNPPSPSVASGCPVELVGTSSEVVCNFLASGRFGVLGVLHHLKDQTNPSRNVFFGFSNFYQIFSKTPPTATSGFWPYTVLVEFSKYLSNLH